MCLNQQALCWLGMQQRGCGLQLLDDMMHAVLQVLFDT